MQDIVTKVLNGLIKAIPTVILSGAGYQFHNGTWFGYAMFGAYLSRQNVQFLGSPSPSDLQALYLSIGSASLASSMSHISGLGIVLTIALTLALVAHVLYKANVVAPSLPGSPGWPAALRQRYTRYYYAITLGTFLLLVSLFVITPLRDRLIVLLAVIVLPSTLYLLSYSRDLVGGSFPERFVWISLLLCLAVTVFSWPELYGREIYDGSFTVASLPATNQNPDHCDTQQLLKGPTFVASDVADTLVFFRLCVRPPDQRFLDFFPYHGNPTFAGKTSLTEAIDNFVPPTAQPDTVDSLRGAIR